MPSLYLDQTSIQLHDQFTLNKEESYHLIHVMRAEEGETFKAVNGLGLECELILLSKNKKFAEMKVSKILAQHPKKNPQIILAAAMLKNTKMDWLIEKAVECGVDEVLLHLSKNSIPHFKNSTEKEQKINRLKSIAVSALKQSNQIFLPHFSSIIEYKEWIKNIDQQYPHSLRLIFSLNEDQKISWKNCINDAFNKNIEKIILLLGPEAGLTKEEENLALQHGFIQMSLGQQTYRAETASIAALVLTQHYIQGDTHKTGTRDR